MTEQLLAGFATESCSHVPFADNKQSPCNWRGRAWINNTFCNSNNVSVLLVFQQSNFLLTNKSNCRNMAYVTKVHCSSAVFITEVRNTFYVY